MALNIKNKKVEDLINQVVSITGENKTEAVLKALEERKQRLSLFIKPESEVQRKMEFLQDEIWSVIPETELGRKLSKEEKERILGFGPEGV